jgi:diketogulonate reductase-like aldo/keto reductase
MEKRNFAWPEAPKAGAFTSLSIPVIGQGTWNMEYDDEAGCIAALRAGLDLGMTHIDTAELYGRGRVEALVGKAIAGRRDEVFLVSKVMPSNASRAGTIKACERSLKYLGTDRLDLYLLHWPGSYPLTETFEAFDELQSSGKIRFFGVSNFDVPDLTEALSITGPGRIACNQILYHLGERRIEHRVMPFCEKNGIPIVGYSPFGAGSFIPERSAGHAVLAEIAKAHRATARQVALRFLVRKGGIFTIPKASKTTHVKDNAGAGELELTAVELRRIDEAFPPGRPRNGIPML